MLKHNFRNAAFAMLAAIAAKNDLEMAAPADVQVKSAALPQSELEALRLSVNQLAAALRIVTAKLDADAGVTDVNYFLLSCDAAAGAAVAPQKVTLVG